MLPEEEGEQVACADCCVVDKEELAACRMPFREIPQDLQELVAQWGKDSKR